MAALAGEIGADLVHLNGPALATGGAFAQPVLGVCHSCLASWWAAVKTGPMPAEFVWRTEALGRGLAACDGLVAPSRAFAEATARAHDVPPPRVVHNGRAPIARPGGEPREPSVLGAGRLWDEGKNAVVLDEAAGRCRSPVRLAGPLQGPERSGGRLRHAEALGSLAPPALGEHMARSAIFASAALYEPFGLAALEAAGAGCALVLSDIATHRELWEGAALFADPARPAAFAAAFDRLIADDRQRRDWAARAHRRAARYTVEAMTAGVLAAYRAIAPNLSLPAPEAAARPAEAAA